MPGKSVPDGWDDYPKIGKRIPDTPFISFKVPLGRNWGIQELVKACPDLKMVIDLTNTNKYYMPRELERKGINHVKILTPGGGNVRST